MSHPEENAKSIKVYTFSGHRAWASLETIKNVSWKTWISWNKRFLLFVGWVCIWEKTFSENPTWFLLLSRGCYSGIGLTMLLGFYSSLQHSDRETEFWQSRQDWDFENPIPFFETVIETLKKPNPFFDNEIESKKC